jgi:hypothetical protein
MNTIPSNVSLMLVEEVHEVGMALIQMTRILFRQMINGFLRPINTIFMRESFGVMDSLERVGGRLCFLGTGKSAKDVVLSRHTLFQLNDGGTNMISIPTAEKAADKF